LILINGYEEEEEQSIKEFQGEKVEPIKNLKKETPESTKESKEDIYESSIVEEYDEGGCKVEITEKLIEKNYKPTIEFEKGVTELGSNIVDESEGSQELYIEDVQEQIPKEQPQEVDIILEDFQDRLPKDLPDDLPPSRNTQSALELAPIDQYPNSKIILNNQGLFHARLPQDSDSYFLPFPESTHISKAIRLHFIEITRLHEPLEPIPFATYFWKTLWHLLGIHDKFSCAYQTRVKP